MKLARLSLSVIGWLVDVGALVRAGDGSGMHLWCRTCGVVMLLDGDVCLLTV